MRLDVMGLRPRHLPNLISGARIAAAPVLAALALADMRTAFTWLLVVALLSDIADGLIARIFSFTSPLGARLDSIGDALLFAVAAFGIWVFHETVIRAYWPAFALVLALWLVEHLAALWRYGRLSSFHTYASRVAAYALGIFVGVLFVWGLQPWLLYLATGLSVLASLEECVLLMLVPEWRADVRGAWWVVRDRRGGGR